MIVLDTNVVSELLRPTPDPEVLRWLDIQPPDTLWLCSIVTAELLFGTTRLQDGRRRQRLSQALQAIIYQDFDQRVLPFDLEASLIYAEIAARRGVKVKADPSAWPTPRSPPPACATTPRWPPAMCGTS